jgi:hypothetical protein
VYTGHEIPPGFGGVVFAQLLYHLYRRYSYGLSSLLVTYCFIPRNRL